MSDSLATASDGVSARLTGAAKGLDEAGLKAVAWAGVGAAGIFLSLRLFARYREARRLFTDDFWMVASFVVLTVNAILQTLQTESLYYMIYVSIGRVPVDEKLIVEGTTYLKYQFAIIGLMWTVLWCVKASFLSLYWRLFDGLTHYKRIWWAVVVFTVLAYFGCWIASAWTCHPPSTYFQFGQCTKPIDQKGSTISISYSTAVDILSDLMIMSLPLRLLKELQVTRPQKIGLAIVFSLGLAIIAVAIIRLTQIIGQARADPVGLAVWGLVESSISVIIGSLPPLKSLLGKQIQKFTSAISGRESGGRQSGKDQSGLHAGRSPFNSVVSKSGARLKSESIPLEDRPGAGSTVTALKSGQIIVQKDFGWTRSRDGGSGSMATDQTDLESRRHSDEHYDYDDEERMVASTKDEEAHIGHIGIAQSIGRRVSSRQQANRRSVGYDLDTDGRVKTSWLQ
ncbi:hypothetical protein A1O3_05633 [Capronia epimyces CBS 606.96]|uniref:Rhodopsin domain-containing protein n=1 Tax=Capronia epimyces CBS 606.96 TaxID=1182542 RepID=W9XXL1_9EURO|nr:uncharacterized protein A1O3_05633 [Capronia epimyces CBS 606.96]EXJ84958.1 hypothetical protein A1O3_05633 [Capronia epimyces CBS 606.96]